MALDQIETEYIKNLQQQVYFLELEANFLYPLIGNFLAQNKKHLVVEGTLDHL